MAKRCPKCGTMNDDELVFCGACTEPLNADVRLVMRVDEMVHEHRTGERALEIEREEREREHTAAPKNNKSNHGDDASHLHIQKKEEKGSAMPMILLGIVAAAAIVFLLK